MTDILEVTKFNQLIEDLTKGVECGKIALENRELKERIEELTELVGDLEEHNVTLEAVCILHGWNPIESG